jgi:hypothetical protein
MTSRQLPRRPRRQRWSVAATTGVTATAVLSGCTTGGDPEDNNASPHASASAAPKGTVSVQETDRLQESAALVAREYRLVDSQ